MALAEMQVVSGGWRDADVVALHEEERIEGRGGRYPRIAGPDSFTEVLDYGVELLNAGRGWKASELRLKSWDDLHKLWYVLLKEKNMLMSQRQMLASESMRFPNPERISKVRRSMCRIKHVLTERAIADPDPRRTAEMKRMINAM
uniref:Large ribosomal subunit protein uL29m n=1 Tax=Aegilops tauschii TaxID=37682 RepID=M8BTW9_AEGTA